jgi:hypothetical protein
VRLTISEGVEMSLVSYKKYLKKLQKAGKDWPRGDVTIYGIQAILERMQSDLKEVAIHEPQTIHSLLKERLDGETDLQPIEIVPMKDPWAKDWVRGGCYEMGNWGKTPRGGSFLVAVVYRREEKRQRIRLGYKKRERL